MKLCQKCAEEIDHATALEDSQYGQMAFVSESECEFWIHKQYNYENEAAMR